MYSGPLRAVVTALLAVGVAAAATGCSSSDSSAAADGKLGVVAAFYPLQYVTQQVGGDHVSVTNLVEPGTEPHDVELSPKQVAQVTDADAVVYLREFQPAVDDAVDSGAKNKSLDVAGVAPLSDGYVPLEEGELHEDEKGKDPHVWLDPTRLAGIADAVAKKLGDLDPDHAAEYTANAKALNTKLGTLDAEYKSGLASCKQKTIVVSHNAFGYLAARYGLTQVPITGLTPEEEPSAARLAEVAKYAKENGVTVIFFETLVSPKIAQALASEVGAKAEVLDPIEGIAKESNDDYFSVMRTNLTTLRGALSCQ
ncbi:metal ABC transporter substrate-binding protein [Cryptosporangium aurantiacum]|uniref:Zinc transport system substrate-binding protein n=1 Tax=Cryptosporangium aurantiacum TaxID=134849 RepID=A0A1M7Q567_9ACTN|nr:metal ABC transporter substrate-binding protein [Cryptosporangium aurantiacum]SHN25524.1 zinc transport system substrate-binding protein [Cryptosporangium aurantiacum]